MEKVQDNLNVTMDYTPAQAHEPRIEQNNRYVKETFRMTLHRTGYDVIPKVMIRELVEYSCQKLIMFLAKHGISSHYSPAAIVEKKTLD